MAMSSRVTVVILMFGASLTTVISAPSHAHWTRWSEWSSCTCASGVRHRDRQCTGGDQSACQGSSDESIVCSREKCPKGKYKEGDILEPEKEQGTAFRANPGDTDTWVTRKVPYVLDYSSRGADHEVWDKVRAAMDIITDNIPDCLIFTKKENEDYDYIKVTSFKNQGCYSAVGMRGGEQIINIDVTCMSVGIILHELMHALGFWHEHSRSDRDYNVKVYYDNIMTDKRSQFDKRNDNLHMERNIEYDYKSILHYKFDQFAARRGLDTIIPWPPSRFNKTELGQREFLSPLDKQRIEWLYKCGKYKVKVCQRPIGKAVMRPSQRTYSISSKISYSCRSAQFLFGPKDATCKDNGQWSGAIPMCFDSQSGYSALDFETTWSDHNGKTWVTSKNNPRFQINAGQTLTKDSGPHTDHTLQFSIGHYAYFEASGVSAGSIATLQSPKLYVSMTSNNVCLLFFYNMYGDGMGGLAVKYCRYGYYCTEILKLNGSAVDNNWYVEQRTLVIKRETSFTIKFEATRGPLATSDIGIDDILIGPCYYVNQYYSLSAQQIKEQSNMDTGKTGEIDTFVSDNSDQKG